MKNTKKTTRGVRSTAAAVAFAAFAAVPFLADAEQKTVAAGATVTVEGSSIAAWTAADINIGDGATLCFSEPVAEAKFTGKITGSGHFVAKAASESVLPKVFNMNGDASGFSGAFFYTNVIPRIKCPLAVGDVAPITIYLKYNVGEGAKSYLWGPTASEPDYVYRNYIDLTTGTQKGLVISSRVTLAGNVLFRTGAMHGPGTLSGEISMRSGYFMNDLHVDGPVNAAASNVTICNLGSIFYLKGKTSGISICQMINYSGVPVFEADNLFDENVTLKFGANFTGAGQKTGKIDLAGHSQAFKMASWTATPDAEDKPLGGICNSGGPATVTFARQDPAAWFYGKIDGHTSLCVSGTKMLGFPVGGNTTDGAIISSNGIVNIGASFPKLRRLVAMDGGTLQIKSADINPGRVDLEIDSASTVTLDTDITVRQFLLNGTALPPNTYTKNSLLVSGRLLGTGSVKVLGIPGFSMTIR